MANNIPIRDIPGDVATPTADSLVAIDNGISMEKTTAQLLTEAGRPVATQEEAETGEDNRKVMTALRVSQAIQSQALTPADVMPIYEARDEAVGAASAASSSAGTASGAASTAQTSAGQAMSYRNAAQAAQTDAETARTGAETAQSLAEAAQADAEQARDDAIDARDAAAASASTASTQAGVATAQAGIATTQAGIATTQAGNAANSASAAATSETNASSSASTATTQAGIATTQAGNAASSASNAAGSEINAAGSASTAASAATIATQQADRAEEEADRAEAAAGANLANSDSRTAAIATNIPPPVNYIRTAGYSEAGDGGGALYKRASIEPSHAGKFQSADGAWWELSEAEPSVKMFGAKGDGATDDTAAIQGALDTAREVFLPEGTYLVSADLTVTNKSMLIRGAGRHSTRIIRSTPTTNAAIHVVCDSGLSVGSRFPFKICDISLFAASPGAGTAIAANFTTSAGGIVYTGITSVTIDNVDIMSNDYFGAGVNYWDKAVLLKDTGSVQISRFTAIGLQSAPNTKGIHIIATNGPNTSFFMNDVAVTWFTEALNVENQTSGYTIEGIYISDFEFVGCDRGVRVWGGPVHALRLSNGHINGESAAVQYEITARGSTTFGMTGCYVQIANLYSGDYKSGSVIALDEVHYSQIIGNYIAGDPTLSVSQNGVALLSSDYCTIEGNTYKHITGTGVLMTSNGSGGDCQFCRAGDSNTFSDVATPYDIGGSTNGAARASKAQNGSMTAATGPQIQWGTSVVTLDSNGNGVIGLPTAFPNVFYMGHVTNGDVDTHGDKQFSINHAASNTSVIHFGVRPSPGAVTVRANYIVFGS